MSRGSAVSGLKRKKKGDKLYDQISDVVLNACLEQDSDTCRSIRFVFDDVGLDADNCKVLVNIEQQCS
ncbi:hypothetical protein F0562_027353 [Nyssa sinensis]|uniref:Uncharacterized protein n=1 Tax=Nyssa sinensis TaxID=561372 RepID=A0A5J5B8I9_9ASTE|nr:hypothetical protein F0562_027353 [Nyssa sinensis]